MTVAETRSRADGFTLVEMLVSLAILGMMSALLLNGVFSAGLVARRAGTGERAGAEVTAAQQMLRDRLVLMRAVPVLGRIDPVVNASGNEQVFDFYAAPPIAGNGEGIQKYRLLLTAPGDLVLYHVGELNDALDLQAPGVVGWKPLRLIGGAASLSIGYFGAMHDEPERKWRAFWRENSRLPELVRVRVAFRGDDARRWPDLIVRPASTIDLACDPEASDGACGKRT